MADRRRGTVLVVLASMLLSGALAACSSGDADEATDSPVEAGRPEAGGTLTIGLAAESDGYDPTRSRWGPSGYVVANALLDPLAAYDADGLVHPYLAERIEPNDDFTEWTITLRSGVAFHDGSPLDAAALAQFLEAHKASALTSQTLAAVQEIEVVDDLAVTVRMSEPWATFPHTLTLQSGYVVAPATLEDGDGASRPIGTGPYVLDEWQPDSHLRATRNEDYWRDGFPLPDDVELRVLLDPTARANALAAGEVDAVQVTGAVDVAALEGVDDVEIVLDETGGTTEHVVYFNHDRPPFDDPEARRAVAAAIDREVVVEAAFGGALEVAEGPFVEGERWFTDQEYQDHDPDLAAELVEAYEERTGEPLSFGLLAVQGSAEESLAEAIQGVLGEQGIDVRVETSDVAGGIATLLTGNYDAGITSVLFGSPHPDREYPLLHSRNAPDGGAAVNFTRLRNDKVDRGLDDARSTGDLDEQAESWGLVQEGLAEDVSFVYLSHNVSGVAHSGDVGDLTRWTFPDGTPGLPLFQSIPMLYQAWSR